MSTPSPLQRFHTTRWSMVQAAGSDGDARDRALEELCSAYWVPLYAFLRQRGRSADRAADLVQGLFHKLLASGAMAQVLPEGGRFRSYLLTALQNYERDVVASEGAEKRGGGRAQLSIDREDGSGLDFGAGERRFQLVAGEDADPEVVFERAWVREVLDQAREALARDSIRRGQGDLFRTLEHGLDATVHARERGELAARLGLSSVALRVALHRLRQRYREQILRIVRETVANPAEAGNELEVLLRALS